MLMWGRPLPTHKKEQASCMLHDGAQEACLSFYLANRLSARKNR